MLAARSIVSAICLKNDPAAIAEILSRRGVAAFFVFSAISWETKGPRLAALIRTIQLRPASVLFIDDNPANLAPALHFAFLAASVGRTRQPARPQHYKSTAYQRIFQHILGCLAL